MSTRREAGEFVVLRGRTATRPPVDAATACHAAAVSKVYGTRDTAVHALRDVTLDIRRGAFTAIMGPSGSGKSTLLHCLAALDTPTSGRVFLGGTELTALSRRQQAQVRRDRIGFVFQSFNLVPTLDALENITLPQLLAGRRPDQAWLHHVIARLGLGDRLHHRPSELSGGQQQRIALARALAGRPEVIFADEPTGNLDTTASGQMLTLLRDAVDQFDQTVVTVTHDPSIASYADQILHFSDGRVVDRTGGPDAGPVSVPPRQDRGVESDGGHHDHRRPAPRRADGRQTMRSRRRRQPEEPTPGRPMVGSDDEVEVARQERWLQRIREQFEAESTGGDAVHADAAADDRWTADDTIQQPSEWTADDTIQQPSDWSGHRSSWRDETTDEHHDGLSRRRSDDGHGADHAVVDVHHDGAQHRFDDHVDGRHDDLHAPDHASAPFHHDAAAADGWLPPERARLYDAPEDPAVDTGSGRWGDDPDAGSEIAPWSRPPTDRPDAQELTQPTETSGWRVTGDPWAPADEHLAEEYHSEQSTGRRARSWQHDSGDIWSTGRWEAQAQDRHSDDRGDGEPQGAAWTDGSARHDTDEHTAAASPAPDADAGGVDAGRYDTRYAHWRHDEHADREQPGTSNGRHRDGDHTDDAPPAVNGHTRDPWTNVWDAAVGPDIGEVWTPTFDHGRHANGNGQGQHDLDRWHDDRGPFGTDTDHRAATDGAGHPVAAPDTRDGGDDSPGPDAVEVAEVPTDRPGHDGPGAPDDDTGDGHAVPPPVPADTAQPPEAEATVTPPEAEATAARPEAEATATHPEAEATAAHPDEVAVAQPAPAIAPRRDAPVPPPLASLRNTRRPDEPRDAMEALQSLQDQLDRLGGRRGRRRPRHAGSGDANRSER